MPDLKANSPRGAEDPAAAASALAPFRRYMTRFVNCHDFTVLPQIMRDDYHLCTSGMDIAGRDDRYRTAVAKQLEQFPGLVFTLHDIFITDTYVCVRFTEHGASRLHEGARAAWPSIAIYEVSGDLLSSCTIEQDYYSRRRQLSEGRPVPVDPPAIAPWDETTRLPDKAAGQIVSDWLDSGEWLDCASVLLDDEQATGSRERIVDSGRTTVDLLVSGGGKVAFHAVLEGTLAADFGSAAHIAGQAVAIHMSGLVTVADNRVATGHIVRDRWGLYRRLSKTR